MPTICSLPVTTLMLDLYSSMPHLFGHHIYYLTLTRLKCFNIDQPDLYNYNDFTRTSSVTSMLNNLNRPLCSIRLLTTSSQSHTTILLLSTVSTCGHNLTFVQLAAKVIHSCSPFFPSAIKLWNSLPDFVIRHSDSTDLNNFKL